MEYGTPIMKNINTLDIETIDVNIEPKVITIKVGGINSIESLEHRETLIKNSDVLVIKYGAEWCRPCKMMAPGFLEMANQESSQNCIYANEDIDDDFGGQPEAIRSIPVIHIYKKGRFEQAIKGGDLQAVKDAVSILKR